MLKDLSASRVISVLLGTILIFSGVVMIHEESKIVYIGPPYPLIGIVGAFSLVYGVLLILHSKDKS